MALSDQLTDLAGRTKRLEDTAAAAEAQNKTKLEQEREKLHTATATEAKKLKTSADKAGSGAQTWWADTANRVEERRAELRAKIDERKAERKVDRAKRNANDAEHYASDLVSLAAYVLDATEYAIVDAAIARAEADALVAAR
jgi:hypothetical protein